MEENPEVSREENTQKDSSNNNQANMGLCNSSGMHRVAPPSGCPAVDVCFKKSCHFVEFDTKAKFTPGDNSKLVRRDVVVV